MLAQMLQLSSAFTWTWTWSWTWTLLALLAGISIYHYATRQKPIFPVVNAYSGDFLHRKAHHAYTTNAHTLVTTGLAKHNHTSPITLLVPSGLSGNQITILPSSLADWIKGNKDKALDHHAQIRDHYFAWVPGFDAQNVLAAEDRMVLDVIRTKLSMSNKDEDLVPIINAAVGPALQHHWSDSDDWHPINWNTDTTGLISRAASSIFVGPEKAADPEWQALVQGYVVNFFFGVVELHNWPAILRPFVHWFLPHASACRRLLSRAREIMDGVVEKREQEIKDAERQGLSPPKYNDVLAWTAGKNHPAGDIQLALATAALFTTTELFKQILLEIAQHPDLVEPLRQEIKSCISEHGLSLVALGKMELLDSVLKEAQRMIPFAVGLERKVLHETSLPDGTVLPQGMHLMVDASDMWNPSIHENPHEFDGYRFVKRRAAGDKASQFVQSSNEHIVFGGGRHICPGRFFAAVELKLCLVHILFKYDIRLEEGYRSEPVRSGVHAVVDPLARLEVRRTQTNDFAF